MSARALILFAHGSRDPLWRAPLDALAARAQALSPGTPVLCAFYEHTRPGLEEAVAQALAQGARRISVWPLFLGVGRHAREDLPRLLRALRQRHPHIRFDLRPPISEHPQVQQAMAQALVSDGGG